MADDLTDLDLYDDEPTHMPQVPPPTVDATVRLPGGSVVRVATVGDEVRATIAGPDGMATLVMSVADCGLLEDLLSNARRSADRNGRGF